MDSNVHACMPRTKKPALGSLTLLLFSGYLLHVCITVSISTSSVMWGSSECVCVCLLTPKPLYVIIHLILSGWHLIITFWSHQVYLDVRSFAQGSHSILAHNVSAQHSRLPSTRLMRCCLSALWLTDLLHLPSLWMCLCVWPSVCTSMLK